MNKSLQQVIIAAVLVISQILLFNNLQLRGMLNSFVAPSIYALFILTMPINTSRVNLLLSAFAIGIAVDGLSGTLGINAAACVLIAYLRPTTLRLLFVREERDKSVQPSIYTLGVLNFFYYTLLTTFIFHLALFFLEVFTFYEAYLTVVRAILSAIAATTAMMAIEFIFVRKNNRYHK
ncbi:MAG: rod shape-determining protein MreD [Prevotellaceae bacterium]|jgi:rod shape-determining protein MreD|nr:rod shape-determining protein MreD [Prevotellaceae bacterium]